MCVLVSLFVAQEGGQTQKMPKHIRLSYGDASAVIEIRPSMTYKECFLDFLRALPGCGI